MIKKTILSIILLFMGNQVLSETNPACPRKGLDPDKFCPVGMIWSEDEQKCLLIVWIINVFIEKIKSKEISKKRWF